MPTDLSLIHIYITYYQVRGFIEDAFQCFLAVAAFQGMVIACQFTADIAAVSYTHLVNLGLNYRSTKGGSFTGEGINSTTVDGVSAVVLLMPSPVNDRCV